mgnify:CR=1 FL=1
MSGQVVLYTTEDGKTRLRAALFQTTPQGITQNVRSIHAAGELERGATCKALLQVQTEGERRVRRRIAPRAGRVASAPTERQAPRRGGRK